jgi:heme-degrading monooxygenase HmoA
MSEIVTVFRNRLRPEASGEYAATSARVDALARTMPGHIDSKTVTFADRASHDAWRLHPDHVEAQREGIEKFYETYAIQVAEVTRSHTFTR